MFRCTLFFMSERRSLSASAASAWWAVAKVSGVLVKKRFLNIFGQQHVETDYLS